MTNPQQGSSDQNPFRNNGATGVPNMQQQASPDGGSQNQYPVPYNQQAQQGFPAQQGYPGQQMAYAQGRSPKSKVVALLLCFFLGEVGAHNFYLGNTGIGIGQLLLFLVTIPLMIFGIGAFSGFALWLWIVIEFFMILLGSNGYKTN